MVKAFGVWEIENPFTSKDKPKENKPRSRNEDIKAVEKDKKKQIKDPTNTINNFKSNISNEGENQTKIPKEKSILDTIQNLTNDVQNYEYDEDILDESNIYKRTGEQITPVEKKEIENKKKLHAELLHIKKEFEKETRNINESSKKEIKILFEHCKSGVAREELDFLKKKINNFNGQLTSLEDKKSSNDSLYKYLFKYYPIIGEKKLSEKARDMVRDFIENFLLLYLEYINSKSKNDENLSKISKSHIEKKGLGIPWKEALEKIIIQNDFLISKLLDIFKEIEKNSNGKKQIFFKIKGQESFRVTKEKIEALLTGGTIKIYNENPEEWEEQEKEVSIIQKEEINIELIANKIDDTISINAEDKEYLLNFLRKYNQWYPESQEGYSQIKRIAENIPTTRSSIITKNIKRDIKELINIKEEELSKREIKILKMVDSADLSKKSIVLLKSLIVDLKENGLGIIEENFVRTQIEYHSQLQTISLSMESNYIYEYTDIHDDINLLKEESLGQSDITYIKNKKGEIENNIENIIKQPEVQEIIYDQDPEKATFKKILITLYIHKKTYQGDVFNILDLKEEFAKDIITENGVLQGQLKKLIGLTSTKINIGNISLEYFFQEIGKKLSEAEKSKNFNVIKFIDIQGLPESIRKIAYPTIRDLLIKKAKYSVFNNTVDNGSSKRSIEKLQWQFKRTKDKHGVPLYTGPIDGKYSSIQKSIERFQHGKEIVFKDNQKGKGIFGPKTRIAFNAIYLEQSREEKNINNLASPEEIEKIYERLKLFHIYMLYAWSEGKIGVESEYLPGNEQKEGRYGYEVYNHKERYEAALKATKNIYDKLKKSKNDKLKTDKNEYLWLLEELEKPSAAQQLERMRNAWNRDKKLIPIFKMEEGIKASYILKKKGKLSARTPANLPTEREMIIFSGELSIYNKKDMGYLYGFLINGNTTNLRKLHKRHFGTYPSKKMRIFHSQQKFEGEEFYNKIMTHVLNAINETKESSSVPYIEYHDFIANYENIPGIGVSKKLGSDLRKIKSDRWGVKSTCGPAVDKLTTKRKIPIREVIKGRRDGYRYEGFLDNGVKKGLFIKVKVSDMSQLVPGAYLVYGKNGLGTRDRKDYGHSEVVGEKMLGSEIKGNKRISKDSPSWKKEIEDNKYYKLVYSYYRSTILGGSSYTYATEQYEKDVIKGDINNFEIFKATTKFTGFMYLPIKNTK